MTPAYSAFSSVLSRLTRHCLLAVGLTVMAVSSAIAVQRQTALVATAPNLYSYQYLLYLPPGYNADASAQWPLMIFLHGMGEVGTNIERVAVNGPPMLIEQGRDFPCVVVSPLATVNFWDPVALNVFIHDRVLEYRIDPHRVYVTGLSMGGYGTWALAEYNPDYFAAVAPLCGGGNPALAYRLRNLPVWAFHGALDATVPVARTQEMIDAIRQTGGDPSVTIYPDLGHDVWTVTYANPSFYDWLFAQNREVLATQPSIAVPATDTSPTLNYPAIPAPTASGAGGGGGGAIKTWFVVALALLGIARQITHWQGNSRLGAEP